MLSWNYFTLKEHFIFNGKSESLEDYYVQNDNIKATNMLLWPSYVTVASENKKRTLNEPLLQQT